MRFARALCLVSLTLACSFAFADRGGWTFSIGCPTAGSQTGNFSFSASNRSGFQIPACATCCSRTSTGFSRLSGFTFSGGTPRSNTLYTLAMGDIMVSPPILASEIQPIFTVSSACPVIGGTKKVNWIINQWPDEAIALDNRYLLGEASISSTGGVIVTGQWDVAGAVYYLGSVTMDGASCTDGTGIATGAANLGGDLYYSASASGVFKTNPGKAYFFIPQMNMKGANLASKLYSGITFDTRSNNDTEDVRNIRGVADSTGTQFLIEPYSDPESGAVDNSAASYTYHLKLSSFNSPKPGMILGTIKQCPYRAATPAGVYNPALECANPDSAPNLGRVSCISHMDAINGVRLMCSGESPADNTTPFHLSLHYKQPSGSGDGGTVAGGFDSNGRVTTDFGSNDDYANAVAIQANGKIVVAGSAGGDFALARYTVDGALDATFDSDGKVLTDLGSTDVAYGIGIQLDGKIVVVGESNHNFAVVRYNLNGTLDASFDTDGIVTTDFAGSDDRAFSVAFLGDKIVAAGDAWFNSRHQFAIAVYRPDGALDTGFNSSGKRMDCRGTHCHAEKVLVDPNGKILVAGTIHPGGPEESLARFRMGFSRYNADGSLDGGLAAPTGPSGTSWLDFNGFNNCVGHSAALQSDGKIVLGGLCNQYFGWGRFLSSGVKDTTFNGSFIMSNLSGTLVPIDQLTDIAVQSDGKIVAVGTVDNFISVARFAPNGAYDPSFGGGDGHYISNVSSAVSNYAWNYLWGQSDGTTAVKRTALAIQPDGKIVAVGNSGGNFFLMRLFP